MKPFLGINITEDKENERFNGDEFIVKRASPMLLQEYEKATDSSMKLLLSGLRQNMPNIVLMCVFGIGFTAAGSIISSLANKWDNGLRQVYDTVPWLIWLAGALLIGMLVFAFKVFKAAKKIREDEELAQIDSKTDSLAALIFAAMGVPSDAADVEILSFRYEVRDGEPIAQKSKGMTAAYDNLAYKAYVADGKLFLADVESLYAFPMDELRAIRTIKEKISIPVWLKDTEPDKGQYKQYKLRVDKEGDVHFKIYYILELAHGGETWGIYFPCYELPVFEALTALTVE